MTVLMERYVGLLSLNFFTTWNDVIEERARTQQSTEKALSDMENLKNSYVDKLKNTRNAFVAFAESCRPDFFEQQAKWDNLTG